MLQITMLNLTLIPEGNMCLKRGTKFLFHIVTHKYTNIMYIQRYCIYNI